MPRPLIIRCMTKTLPLVAGLDRECFPDSLPGDELIAYSILPTSTTQTSVTTIIRLRRLYFMGQECLLGRSTSTAHANSQPRMTKCPASAIPHAEEYALANSGGPARTKIIRFQRLYFIRDPAKTE